MELLNADYEAYLQHFGRKGMHWGQHVFGETPTGASGHVNRQAKSDANEFAKAKLFYGEGAGTRRKLIRAKVEQRSKQVPGYKEAFNHHLGTQDLEKRAAQATRLRRRKDTAGYAGKTVRGVNRRLNGGVGPVTVSAAAAAAGLAYLHSSGADKILLRKAADLSGSSLRKAGKILIDQAGY